MKRLRYLVAILFAGFAIAADQPNSVVNVVNVATLNSGTFTNIKYLAIGGYHQNGDGGGGSLVPDTANTCSGTANAITCFSDGAGNIYVRQNYTGDIRQGGVYADGVTQVSGGTMTAASNQFTLTTGTFPASAVGQWFIVNFPTGTEFTTKITAVNGATATLESNSPENYPGVVHMTDLSSATPPNGTDLPGAGISPGDTLVLTDDVGTIETSKAGGIVTNTQFAYSTDGGGNQIPVLTISAAGTGYFVGESLDGTCSFGAGKAVTAPILQVATINGGGGVTGLYIINGGNFQKANPTGCTWLGDAGTGFTTTFAASNGSFGVFNVAPKAKGSYTTPPTNPVHTTFSGVDKGATVDATFSSQDFTRCHDDTVALQANLAYAATLPTTMRGLVRGLTIPAGTQTCISGVTVTAPIMISGSGPKQSRIAHIPGSGGTSVNGSPTSIVTWAPAYPTGDSYNHNPTWGQIQGGLQDVAVIDLTASLNIDYRGSNTTEAINAVTLTPPANNAADAAIPFYCSNVEFAHTPGDLLDVNNFHGTVRCYNAILVQTNSVKDTFANTGATSGSAVLSGISTTDIASLTADLSQAGTLYINADGFPYGTTVSSIGATSITLSQVAKANGTTGTSGAYGGGDCLKINKTSNPTRFYYLITSGCNIGRNILGSAQLEFHGWTGFGYNIGTSITGSTPQDDARVNDYGAQYTGTAFNCLYYDGSGGTLYEFGALFKGCQGQGITGNLGISDIIVGPDAGTGNKTFSYPSLVFYGGGFGVSNTYNIYFDTDLSGNHCMCSAQVAAGSMTTANGGTGAVLSNLGVPNLIAEDLIAPLVLEQGAIFRPQTAPTAPPSGWFPYTDAADSKLKAIFSDGTIIPLTPVIGYGAPIIQSNLTPTSVGTGSNPYSWEATIGATPNTILNISALPAAVNKWECNVSDGTTANVNPMRQTASGTMTAAMTGANTMVAGDVVHGICQPH